MAQILEIRTVCDVCADIHDKETPADTYTVSVQIVGEADSPAPFDVELCGEHGAELASAVLALVKYGRAPAKGRPAAATSSGRADQTPGAFTCP